MMIARICGALLLALIVPGAMVQCEAKFKGARESAPEVWLTQAQASEMLIKVDTLVKQIRELSDQNRAPRPNALQPCDPGFPGCGTCDLTCVLADLCAIQNQLICICENTLSFSEIVGVIGSCTDTSVLLGSQVDKSCIDSLCLSVVALLKTILLELRGAFTGPFPCDVTP